MEKNKKWRFSEGIAPYAKYLDKFNGHDPEQMVSDFLTKDPAEVFLPESGIDFSKFNYYLDCVMAQAQVQLLYNLVTNGVLKTDACAEDETAGKSETPLEIYFCHICGRRAPCRHTGDSPWNREGGGQ